MADRTINITVTPQKTIVADPLGGSFYDGCEGDVVTWECPVDFNLFFFELSATGATVGVVKEGTRTKSIKLPRKGTFFKYIIQIGAHVLDPYIGVTH
jgi:ribosomal protein L16/L10AE